MLTDAELNTRRTEFIKNLEARQQDLILNILVNADNEQAVIDLHTEKRAVESALVLISKHVDDRGQLEAMAADTIARHITARKNRHAAELQKAGDVLS